MTDHQTKKNPHPGIRKITTASGQTKYRLVVDMGERPDGKRDQRCETFTRLGDAKARQSEIKNSRGKGTLVRPSKITLEELCQRWRWTPDTTYARSPGWAIYRCSNQSEPSLAGPKSKISLGAESRA
jgi:hypothetical protein